MELIQLRQDDLLASKLGNAVVRLAWKVGLNRTFPVIVLKLFK